MPVSTRFWLWLLGFGQVVLLLLIIANHTSEQRQPNVEHAQPSDNQQQDSQRVAAPTEARARNQDAAADRDDKTDELLNKLRDPMLWVTLAIAFFAFQTWRVYEQIRDDARSIHRAFINPIFNRATYQDDRLRFEIVVDLKNTGVTPARDVLFKADIRVFPWPIPDSFDYSLPDVPGPPWPSFLAPGATKFIARTFPFRVPDEQVIRIKRLDGMCLLMWGVVTYRDGYGKPHTLKFAQIARWVEQFGTDANGRPLPDIPGTVDAPKHNEAD